VRAALFALVLVACSHDAHEHQTVAVHQDDLVIGVDVVGELEAVDSTDIKPPPIGFVWEFKIANLAPEGQDVKAGDPVVGFDPSDQMRELENMANAAEAAQKALEKRRDDAALARRDEALKIAEAEAGLRKAKLKIDQPTDLVASIAAKEAQLDAKTAELALEAAKAHAARSKRSDEDELRRLSDKAAYAKKRTEELQKSIAQLQVKAPRAGTVVYPTGYRGDKHKVGDSVSRMEGVIQVVSLGEMIAGGRVDEVDMAKLADNQPVSLRLDALPDAVVHGKVQSIARSMHHKSENDPSKVVHLKIALDATTLSLRPGMRFRGQVETEKLAHVVQVPAEAVFVRPDGPVAYRETASGGFERVKVVLGRRSATAIEVKSGLAPGDHVSRIDPEAAW
jgi:multidrug efflux pump subunit AcrA (membrane-fusion protein)